MPEYCSLDLDECRKEPGDGRSPFPHQQEAFKAMDKLFSFKAGEPRSALLVLPTGAGKTFTSVNWIARKAFAKNIKVLWLAQSFHLLDQAFESFASNARQIPPPAKVLNLRVVSSHPSHDQVHAIATTDDVVIITSQTATSALNKESLGITGERFVTKLEVFVQEARKNGLMVVLDEAHHAPAYGCRKLLERIRELVPDMTLLGLTATPTYTDEAKRGWFGKIFSDGIVYKAEQANLIAQNILAKPVFVEMPTGLELEVDNDLYRRLVQEHKDMPKDIVELLARNSMRNDYIVNEYIANKAKYGKTIIFADRWFQCLYIKDKLKQQNIRAEAVFSRVDGAQDEEGLQRSTTTVENAETIRRFKANEVDVLVNVRMLSEGSDVPDTRTIFVTRQTTSSILFTQMIGRGLRGKKAGGGATKDHANIVLFVDKWKHLLDIWVKPDTKGGFAEANPPVRGHKPMDYIAIRLVENLIQRIDNPGVPDQKAFLEHIPVGWYQTEYSVATIDEGVETTERVREFVMVFASSKVKYDRFLQSEFANMSEEWGKEGLAPDWVEPQVKQWIANYFGDESDDLGNSLAQNLTSLARHMGSNGSLPDFISFAKRDLFDLDHLAAELYSEPVPHQLDALQAEFRKDGNLWSVFYKDNFEWFQQDFNAALLRLWREKKFGPIQVTRPTTFVPTMDDIDQDELDSLIKQAFSRDKHTCLACGVSGKGVKLQADHILSRNHGGATRLDNLQTLCSVCNGGRYKGVNDIDFRPHKTPLNGPKPPTFLSGNRGEDAERSIRRLVNFFYHCGAVCEVKISQRKNGKNHSTWEIILYRPNNPDWLLQHKEELISHIAQDLGCNQVEDIVIRN